MTRSASATGLAVLLLASLVSPWAAACGFHEQATLLRGMMNWVYPDSLHVATAVWKDPDFNPAQRAFYYGRVVEIPTPRWTAYDAKTFGVRMPPEVPMTTTERAYTSPIWYTPGKP